MPLISTRAGASARGFSHMASSILPGFNNNSVLAVAHDDTPYLTVYKFNDVTGFGTKYSNPATLPGGNGNSVSFKSDGAVVAVANESYPGVSAYPWSSSTGFGTKYTLTFNNFGTAVHFNSAGTDIAVGSISSPYIHAFPWSSGFGTKYSNPATLPGSNVTIAKFNPAGTALALGQGSSPWIAVYAWSSGFGTKYADPATTPSTTGQYLDWSPAGDALVISWLNVQAYAWSSGFGTKYANPPTFPATGSPYPVKFNSAGTLIAFGNTFSTSGSVPVVVHPWSSSTGFGTRYSNPSVGTTGTSEIRAIDWNPTETAIAFGGSQSPYIHAYAWFGGFGTKYSNPATLPGGIVNDAEFI